MSVKSILVYLYIALTICLIQAVFAMPKDSTVYRPGEIQSVSIDNVKSGQPSGDIEEKEVPHYGRIVCQFEEAIEDPVCQEHCIPKGYSYGLCVSRVCSCI